MFKIQRDKEHFLKRSTLSTPVATNSTFEDFEISSMFDFKQKEHIEECYKLLSITKVDISEKDVIDIQFAGYFAAKPKNPNKPEKHTGRFIAKILQKGNKSGLEKVREDLSGSSRYAYREKAKASAIKYIDDLFAKYSKG